MWGSDGHRLAVVAYVDALRRSGRPASSSAETNCDDADASMTTVPPRHRARRRGPRTAARRGRRRRPRRRARAARRAPRRSGALRMCGSPSKDDRRRWTGRRPAARTASPCRPGRSRPRRRRSNGAGRDRPVVAGGVDRRAERGQGVRHQQRCRATGARGVRRTGRRRSRPAPAPGWSATCCRAARPTASTGASGARRRPGVGGPGRRHPGQAIGRVSRACAAASLASRRAACARCLRLAATSFAAAAGPPGDARLALGVDRRRASGRRGCETFLKKCSCCCFALRRVATPPRTGGRRASSAPARRPARPPRAAAPGRWPAQPRRASWTAALIRTSVTGSSGTAGGRDALHGSGTRASVTPDGLAGELRGVLEGVGRADDEDRRRASGGRSVW